jgi:hypothetical protein
MKPKGFKPKTKQKKYYINRNEVTINNSVNIIQNNTQNINSERESVNKLKIFDYSIEIMMLIAQFVQIYMILIK